MTFTYENAVIVADYPNFSGSSRCQAQHLYVLPGVSRVVTAQCTYGDQLQQTAARISTIPKFQPQRKRAVRERFVKCRVNHSSAHSKEVITTCGNHLNETCALSVHSYSIATIVIARVGMLPKISRAHHRPAGNASCETAVGTQTAVIVKITVCQKLSGVNR